MGDASMGDARMITVEAAEDGLLVTDSAGAKFVLPRAVVDELLREPGVVYRASERREEG